MTVVETLLDLINTERAKAGLDPLQANEELATAATAHARDMAENDYFSHTSADGRTPAERAAEHGYTDYGGENIAWGYSTPEEVAQGWMDSEGHRRNILNPDQTVIGIGVQERPHGGPLWVTKFGRGVAP